MVDFFIWTDLVQHFSDTRFSYVEDRYYAFLGLASMVQSYSGSTYVCGLWMHDILLQLAWRADGWIGTSRQAWLPTWSWLSIDTQVTHPALSIPSGKEPQYAEVIEIPTADLSSSEDHCTVLKSLCRDQRAGAAAVVMDEAESFQ